MDKQREYNYDLLRIVACIAVVVIHVSGIYKDAITDIEKFGFAYSENFFPIMLWNSLSRFAVPCFVMLSGAFLLSDEKNADYGYFYRKSKKNIVAPTLFFTVLYLLYSVLTCIVKIMMHQESDGMFSEILINLIKGEPYYHLWYMYMLVVLYVLIPVIIRIKKDFTEIQFRKITYIVFIMCVISGYTSEFMLHYSISKVICYVGYLLLGYEIKMLFADKKNNLQAVFLILIGFGVQCIPAVIQYKTAIGEFTPKLPVVSNFSPFIVIATVFIFIGFSRLSIKTKMFALSAHSFNIYLIHAAVWHVIAFVGKDLLIRYDCRITIPICVAVVFAASYLLSVLYSRIDGKLKITEKIAGCFEL